MNSAMRIYEPVVGIEGVSSNGNATIKLPAGRRYMMVRIFAAATISGSPSTVVTDILESVTTMIRGREVRVETIDDIVKQRAFFKLATDSTGALVLYYANPALADVIDETRTAWPLFDGEGEVTIKLKLKSGLTSPSLSAIAVYDGNSVKDQQGRTVKQIVKRYSITKPLGSVGDLVDLPVEYPILGIYLKGESGKTIDKVKVTVDNTNVVHEMTRQENAAFLSDYNLDASQFHYPLRFDVEGQLDRRLDGIRSLNIRVHSSAAQTIEAVMEVLMPDYL